jgi:hypothetical protein
MKVDGTDKRSNQIKGGAARESGRTEKGVRDVTRDKDTLNAEINQSSGQLGW